MSDVIVARRLPRPFGAVALLVVWTAGAWLWATPAVEAATTHTVEVQNRSGGSLHPADLEVHVGDTVTWTWVGNEWHSIAVDDHGRSACSPLDPRTAPCDDHTFSVTFDAAGEFAVRDEVTGSAGTVTVTTPPPPKPSPTPSPTPSPSSPTPSPPPEPSPPPPSPPAATEPSDPGPTTTASPAPSPPPPTQPAAPPPPTTDTADAPPVDIATRPEETPTVGDPTVATADDTPSPIPTPTFEDFPDPVDPTPVADVEGDVAIGPPGDGGRARVVWGLVGGATLLGTLGAFGRTVLFSEPWDG